MTSDSRKLRKTLDQMLETINLTELSGSTKICNSKIDFLIMLQLKLLQGEKAE